AAEGIALLKNSLERVLCQRREDVMSVQRYNVPVPGSEGSFEERYWSAVNVPVLAENGDVAWIIHRADDVTASILHERALDAEMDARRRAELALRQAQKMEAIGQLTGGIAHDFNNLLTVVGGSIDLIRTRPEDAPRVKRLADSAMKAIERCERLIRQLMIFSRQQIMRPETIDPNRLISEFVGLIGRVTVGHCLLSTDLAADVGPIHVDPTQFEAALLNLIVNAREAIDVEGRIIIETRNAELGASPADANPGPQPAGYVAISVSDTGHGIPEDQITRVFDPFFTTKEVGKGSGLGLSQVYGFTQESGGRVTIYSEVGIGTTVRLYLPQAAQPARPPAPKENPFPLKQTSSNETVLVVEDEDAVLDMAAESLQALGYRVLTARNARQALDILAAGEAIDILFSDVVMPGGMNGVQLAVEARRLKPSLKVLLTSGYTAAALTAQHGLDTDIALLEKPYRPQDLAQHLRVIVGGG
ncbi:MAG TPA: ATP-binding protein, partial [Alphaproteobacteria bacterium]|nr:ATP-binding protein [Alphaproteobacteria bacterium]